MRMVSAVISMGVVVVGCKGVLLTYHGSAGEPGDLIFHVNTLVGACCSCALSVSVLTLVEQKHARFQRVGNHLFTNVTITLRDALTGFDMDIEHLDGMWVSWS